MKIKKNNLEHIAIIFLFAGIVQLLFSLALDSTPLAILGFVYWWTAFKVAEGLK